jgi:NTE family protein
LVWSQLEWSESGVAHGLDSRLVEPLRRLAGVTIDLPRGLGFIRLEAPDTLPRGFDAHLFGDATLQNLPDRPGIVICATNLQSGALWRFSKPYMADYRVGQVRNPTVPLAVAVAASAAYSPLLMPIRLRLSQADYVENTGTDLQHPPFTTEVLLADGGIRDSLALEASWRRYQTVFVADGGGQTLRSHPSPGRGSLAPLRLVQRTLRINELVQGQVRSLYKRQLINSYVSGARTGTYWGLGTHIEDFGVPDSLPCRPERILELWNLPPRLRALDAKVQERLINWGYAVCDAAIRAHFDPALPGPRSFPYPDSGV